MTPNGPRFFQRNGRARLLEGLLLSTVVALCGCRTVGDPRNAPATGSIGGMALGAAIGSGSGHVAGGAVLGTILGSSGGELVRARGESADRSGRDSWVREFPKLIKAAERFDSGLKKEHQSLARRRSNQSPADSLVVKAQAERRLPEIDGWIRRLEACDADLASSLRHSYDPGRVWKDRQRLGACLSSLKTHRSLYKLLTS